MQHLNTDSSVLLRASATWYSKVFLPVLLVILGAYPPLSTDMYLPSLPDITSAFNTTEATVNLTLVLFFIFFAFATLIWGPISDKFGRKPSLIAGVTLFSLASAGCIWSGTITQLIIWRVLQALGAGAPVTISIAIVQDTYSGLAKKKMLATLSALMMVAPVIAPTLGAAILAFGQWRVVFMLLLGLGLISLAGCLFLEETRQEKADISIFQAFGSLFEVLKSPFFQRALAAFSLPALFALGFVGGSALIFMNEFGVSSTQFSIFFATNAVFAILGSAIYVPLLRWFTNEKMIKISFMFMLLSGCLIICFGRANALMFLLCVIPGTAMTAILKPISMDVMMDFDPSKAGAISSMVNFFFTMIGSLGMQILAVNWHSRALAYGIMAILTSITCLLVWKSVEKIKG